MEKGVSEEGFKMQKEEQQPSNIWKNTCNANDENIFISRIYKSSLIVKRKRLQQPYRKASRGDD